MGSEPAGTWRMLLIDDHPVVRRGLHDMLARAFPDALIEHAASGAEATALVLTQRWHIAVLDLSLPDGSGLDVLKRFRRIAPVMPVLILSMHTPDQFARRAVAAGASGYLSKEVAGDELVQAVTRLLRGGTYYPADVLAHIAAGLHPDRGGRLHERLSDREHQVLCLIGRGRTVSEIAAELGVSVKTVSTYRSRILEKLQLRRTAELTRYALRHGLVE